MVWGSLAIAFDWPVPLKFSKGTDEPNSSYLPLDRPEAWLAHLAK